jgi:hypothetical protein
MQVVDLESTLDMLLDDEWFYQCFVGQESSFEDRFGDDRIDRHRHRSDDAVCSGVSRDMDVATRDYPDSRRMPVEPVWIFDS